ncbi:MAG: hypothetical protein GY811_04725 [Myxococcales bacterium]|nr:hypothetical protein [Myxococcales bacterium]
MSIALLRQGRHLVGVPVGRPKTIICLTVLSILALCGRADAEEIDYPATLELAWWNDLFAATLDDDGFTADVEALLGLHVDRGALRTVAIGARYRWITESNGGRRRWDLIELTSAATFEFPSIALAVTPRAGSVLAGNLGGARLQDLGHRIIMAGRTLDDTLQDTYPASRRVGAIAGLNVRATFPLGRHTAISPALDGQVAYRTGVRWFYPEVAVSYRDAGFDARTALSATWYDSPDAQLTIPGGYASAGPCIGARLSMSYQFRWFTLGYELRLNEGGSTERTAILFYRLGRGLSLRTH